MSLFKDGNKFKSVFINGDSWSKAYLNGDLIFQKGSPAPTGNFMSIWWNDTSTSIVTEEIITSIADINALCSNTSASSYQITLSNGHTFRSSDVVDIHFNNATTFPTAIPAYFGRKFTSLNIGSYSGDTTLTVPDACTIIGSNFLDSSSYNASDIDINNVITIGAGFLQNTPFNGTITGLTNVDTIGTNFLFNCMLFNKPITCNPLTIGGSFLAHDSTRETNAMTSNINLGNRLTSIGTNFLGGQPSRHNVFNGTINIPATLQIIGNRFMFSCNYSGGIDLENTAVSSIGDDFNANGAISAFKFPTGQSCSVGSGFMHAHSSAISGTLTIPSNITYIGADFLYCASNNYIYSSIICSADPSNWATDSTYLSCCYSKRATGNVLNLTVTGVYASAFKTKYPASDASLSYTVARYYAA